MKRIVFAVLIAVLPMVVSAQKMQKVKETETYHIYNKEKNGGVVITDADGQAIGYTDRGNWEDAQRCEVFNVILRCMDEAMRLQAQKPKQSEASEKLRRALRAESAGEFKPFVNPLLRNLWSQYEAPYDWLAPKVDGEPCEAGCVALSMAQVMHYWQHPVHGYGSYTYFDKDGCGQELTANFSEHYYDWDNMLGNYAGVDYTEAQGYAVAQLLYDCGVSVDMKYGVEASGAEMMAQPHAMVEYFGYDRSCQMYFRDFYTIDEWTNMLMAELSAGRPVLMSGISLWYNHAFVCDGYDERGFFHMSFGNENGAADGFFYLPYLTPDIRPSMNPDEAEGGFNVLQTITTRVMPANHPDATGKESHVFAMSGMEAIDSDVCVVRKICNLGWNHHNDSVSIALLSGDDIVDIPYTYDRDFLLEEIDDTTYTDTIQIVPAKSVKAGTYRLMPMYKDNGVWQPVRTSVGWPNYLVANVSAEDKQLTLHADESAQAVLTLESVSFPEWLKADYCIPECNLRVTCHNADWFGRIIVMLENVDETQPSVVMQQQGMQLAKGETVDLRYYHSPRAVPAGTYHLRIYYDNEVFGSTNLFDGFEQTVIVSATPNAIEQANSQQCEGKAYGLNGVALPDNLPRGVYIKGQKKWLSR